MAKHANAQREQVMDHDGEYAPTEEEIEQEEKEEPLMMQNAARWDRFLELVRSIHVPWPQGEADSISYRARRARRRGLQPRRQGRQRPEGADAHADDLGATHRRLH
eukprot:2749017-Prymnesium_polylepis.1